MHFGLVLMETEAHAELPIPGWGFGLLAFGILVVALLITLSVGKGRKHS